MRSDISLGQKIKSIISCSIYVFAFQGSNIGTLLMIFGSNKIRIFLLFLLFLQYFVIKERKRIWLKKFFLFLDGEKYFNDYTVTYEEDLDTLLQ